MAHILLVEDDESLRFVLRDNLEERGHTVTEAKTIAESHTGWTTTDPDLVILDLMLPDGDGYTLCRQMRATGDQTPVLMLTARSLEDDLISGFEAGADDYLTKPYRLRELLARVDALLRRRTRIPTQHHLGHFQVDPSARTVIGPNGPVDLTRTEFDLLLFLINHPKQALSRDQILDAVWGAEVVVAPRTIDNFVSNLKKKLGWQKEASWAIHTVRGVGYRFEVGG